LIKACASAFDYYGPASTLIREFKFNGRFAFAKDAAAFMMVQLSRLNWPMPDALIPVPQTLTSWLKRGYNQSSLIAQELSRMINVPVVDILKKSFTEFSQTGLDRQQRNRLSAEAFGLKRKSIPPNQTLLLIDDVLTTGATLQSCAAVLHQTFPSAVYALTFAHNSET
jgi:ComF family protein